MQPYVIYAKMKKTKQKPKKGEPCPVRKGGLSCIIT